MSISGIQDSGLPYQDCPDQIGMVGQSDYSSSGNRLAQLDIQKMEKLVRYYLVSPHLLKSSQDSLLKQDVSNLFMYVFVVLILAEQKLKHSTIKVYLSAVRKLQTVLGISDLCMYLSY